AMAAQYLAERKAARDAAARAREPVKWGRLVTIGALALIALVVSLLHIVPLSVGGTEKLLTEQLQEPVSIGALRFAAFPSPHLTVQRIFIGKGQDAMIEAATVPASPLALFRDRKHFDEVRLSGVTIDQDVVPRMAGWTKSKSGERSLQIDRLEMSGLRVALRDVKLRSLGATITLGKDGAFKKMVLREPPLRVDFPPAGDQGWQADLKGKGWRPPLGLGMEFSDLSGSARITSGQAVVSGFDGTLYNGSVKGEATIKWGSNINAEGRFNVKGSDLGQLLPAMASAFSASGALDTNATFASEGQTPGELLAAPRVNATFTLRKGTINNVDVMRALQAPGRTSGKTQFDEITGEAQVEGNRIAYRNLRLNSAPMQASGAIDVLPNSDLSGRITVQVGTRTTTVARGTLNVGGSVRSTQLTP